MKRTLWIIGALLVVIVLGGLATLSLMGEEGPNLDRESKEFVDASVPLMATGWRADDLRSLASPELLRAQGGDLGPLASSLSELGSLKHYNGADGEANIDISPNHGETITATYTAHADFSNGPADLHLRLIKHDEQWQLLAIEAEAAKH